MAADRRRTAARRWSTGHRRLRPAGSGHSPGLVPHAEMPAYLAACDILVSPHGRQADGGVLRLADQTASNTWPAGGRSWPAPSARSRKSSSTTVRAARPTRRRQRAVAAIVRLVDDAGLRARLALPGAARRQEPNHSTPGGRTPSNARPPLEVVLAWSPSAKPSIASGASRRDDCPEWSVATPGARRGPEPDAGASSTTAASSAGTAAANPGGTSPEQAFAGFVAALLRRSGRRRRAAAARSPPHPSSPRVRARLAEKPSTTSSICSAPVRTRGDRIDWHRDFKVGIVWPADVFG